MRQFIRKLMADQRGAALVEYVILVALIALVVIAAVNLLGQTLQNVFNNVQQNLANI